jgi:hypothetical protein
MVTLFSLVDVFLLENVVTNYYVIWYGKSIQEVFKKI